MELPFRPKQPVRSTRDEALNDRPRPKGTIVRLPVHSELVSALRNLIIEGQIQSDDELSERALGKRLGASRSPLREAIKAIAAEGLLEIIPNCGARLVRLSSEELKELTQVVSILEIAAARVACEQASDADLAHIGEVHFRMARYYALKDWANYFEANAEIHQLIVDAAGNHTLSATYRRLNMKLRSFRYQLHFVVQPTEDYEVSIARSMADHTKIFESITRRDAQGSMTILGDHYNLKASFLEYWVNLQASGPKDAPADQ
jgi:DNA-binding GntR family transcriptional regulator